METIISHIDTNISINNNISDISIVDNQINIIQVQTDAVDITVIDVGIQGIKGASGKFEDLTILEKQELLGDIISTNYTNLFNSVLLS